MKTPRTNILRNTMLAGLLATTTASAAIYTVDGGRTDVFLDPAVLASIGWGVSGVGAENLAPLDGFATAFPILGTSTFSFSDDPSFAFLGGIITHGGSVSLTNSSVPPDTITVGDFDIAQLGLGFGIRDTLLTNAFLFDIDLTSAGIASDETSLVISGGILRATEALSNALVGDSSIVGAQVGTAQVSATLIPEPGTALLGVFAGLFALRRVRH